MNIYSGINSRSLAETKKNTFSFVFNCDSNSGIAALGFSGEGNDTVFNLTSGKLYDPEGRYVFACTENKTYHLSGQISGTNYDYYINKEPVCFIGKKNDYKIQKFLINTTGCNLTSDVEILAPEYGFKSNYETGIYLGQSITGKIESTDSDRKFQIFSGKMVSPTGITFSGFDEGSLLSSTLTFNVTDEAKEYETYVINADIYTNFGTIREKFETQIVPRYAYNSYFSTSDVSQSNGVLSGSSSPFSYYITGSGVTQTGDWYVAYEAYSSKETVKYNDPKEINITFDYVTGNTGNYYVATGFNVISGGSGYRYPTSLSLNQSSSGHTSVTGSAVARLAYAVTGLDLTYAGTGYTGVPSVAISGGGGSGVFAEAFTGVSGSITGLNLVSGGSGYFTTPTVSFSLFGTGALAEKATGIASIGSGYVYSCTPSSYGAYLDYQPSVTVSGGGTGAYVEPLFSGYEKTITSLFDVQTGLLYDSGNGLGVGLGFLSSYSYFSHVTGNTGFYNPNTSFVPSGGIVLVRLLKTNFHDTDEMVGRVSISGMIESYSYYNVTGMRINK